MNNISFPLSISSITAMELIIGARNKNETKRIEKFLASFEIIYVDENISKIALELITKYAKSHTLDIPDSLIAATVLISNSQLFTLNKKDFKFIPNLKLY